MSREKKAETFEASMSRLDEIVTLLEENEQSLDETVKLFEEGLKLVKVCDGRLKEFEERVRQLSSSGEELSE
ncbi:MAG: exodeoxyribonuclease VII small subunit [Solobacterium sp.]|nr:exodeoxyribonuclease VII small subunit [Solobacterium sp.]